MTTGQFVQRISVDYMDGTSNEYVVLTDALDGNMHWQKFKRLDGSILLLFYRNVKSLVFSPEWKEEEKKDE